MVCKKILIVATDFKPTPGGISEYTANVARHLHLLGHAVTVLAEQKGDRGASPQPKDPYRVIRIDLPDSRWPLTRKRLLQCFFAVYRVVRRIRPHCLFCSHASVLSIHCTLICGLLRIPYFATAHGKEVRDHRKGLSYKKLERQLFFRYARKVFCVSEFTRRSVYKELGGNLEKMIVIPNGVDPDLFEPSNGRRGIEGHKLNNRKVLLTLSRLVERKGIDQVLRALPEVLEQVPDLVYIIAGTGLDAPRLKHLAAELGLKRHVIFAGYVPENEKVDFYRACDVFVMPARELEDGDVEGFGIVFLEANACGKPVIGGRSGGIPEAIVHGETGLLVDPMDTHGIAGAIIRLFENKAEARKMGLQGRQRIRDALSWHAVTKRIQDQINGSLDGCHT